MRDVESASEKIARKYVNDEFLIPPSRLSDLETKGIIPSIYRLYSLAAVYRQDMFELMSWFGVNNNELANDNHVSLPTRSHISESPLNVALVNMPVRLDPGFDTRRTANFSRMIEKWGAVPMAYLEQFSTLDYTYGYIGSEDLTMYPILPPGTFVQVDEKKNQVSGGGWGSEFERPVYFVETREGHTCCWCTVNGESIILQPHPQSPVAARVLKYPQQAEVIGQVVGVAMRLGQWRAEEDSSGPNHTPLGVGRLGSLRVVKAS